MQSLRSRYGSVTFRQKITKEEMERIRLKAREKNRRSYLCVQAITEQSYSYSQVVFLSKYSILLRD